MKINKLYKILLVLNMVSFASGCFSTDGVDAQLIATIEGRNNKSIQSIPDPLPTLPELSAVVYKPGSRDPMRPNISFSTDLNLAPDLMIGNRDPRRPEDYVPEPLETNVLSSLKLIGIMKNNGKAIALIKDYDNVTHPVGINNYLGLKFGKVTSVNESFIEVLEIEYSAADNIWTETTKIINLETKPL
ncbi:hypothetical protein AwWohl_03520 [Gammaproteobacteria bacterium]|nr:hypothetical protein AwWohl_03520 [Gammaproteobacteria bacterium]